MAFLDNSGDIILDAVLTDTGRYRLAKGDGSFKIVKYAFADDEIDYSKYNKSHTSGSAYYDLDILKTPVLEAFTNNTSNMKHKLLSIPRTNLLYLPVLSLNDTFSKGGFEINRRSDQAQNQFVLLVDENSEQKILGGASTDEAKTRGIIKGFDKQSGQSIVLDQGLNTTAISFKFALDPDLMENRYIVEIDNRLGAITDDNGTIRSPNFIDDDNIASYTFTLGSDPLMVSQLGNSDLDSIISGPRGSRLKFSLAASIELNSSTFLFTKLGSSGGSFEAADGTDLGSGGTGTIYNIDTVVKVTGGSTGRSLDIPVRFLKYVA
jgi:hypothetical protein